MLEEKFSHLLPYIAIGVCGSGSECFGYDDELSVDHDFEPGFCIFLPSENIIDRKAEFELERAYEKLPREFLGYRRPTVAPADGKRRGVIRYSNFFIGKTGTPDGNMTLKEWFAIPEQSLWEATNGKIFFDGFGEITSIRQRLSYLPQDVRLKRIAGNLIVMEQTGLYNYPRLISRGDTAAAQLALYEFVKGAMGAIFALERRYLPYYKWSFRALSELPRLSHLHTPLARLITAPEVDAKQSLINQIWDGVIKAVISEGLSDFTGEDANGHAFAINRQISDTEVRNLNILYGI